MVNILNYYDTKLNQEANQEVLDLNIEEVTDLHQLVPDPLCLVKFA